MPTYEDPQPSGDSSGESSWFDDAFHTVSEVATASASGRAMGKMASEAKEMLSSAKSGGFRVSEDAGRPIRDALTEIQTRVDEMIFDFKYFTATEPTLGGHAYGREVAAHQQRSAAMGGGSPLSVLHNLKLVLADADESLKIAMQKYDESDSSISSSFESGQV